MLYVVPITSSPNNTVRVNIPIDGKLWNFELFFHYNVFAKLWFMDISDADTGEELVFSVPLRSGIYPRADLLEPYEHLGIGSAVLVHDSGSAPLDDTNLGTDYLLVWGDRNGGD